MVNARTVSTIIGRIATAVGIRSMDQRACVAFQRATPEHRKAFLLKALGENFRFDSNPRITLVDFVSSALQPGSSLGEMERVRFDSHDGELALQLPPANPNTTAYLLMCCEAVPVLSCADRDYVFLPGSKEYGVFHRDSLNLKSLPFVQSLADIIAMETMNRYGTLEESTDAAPQSVLELFSRAPQEVRKTFLLELLTGYLTVKVDPPLAINEIVDLILSADHRISSLVAVTISLPDESIMLTGNGTHGKTMQQHMIRLGLHPIFSAPASEGEYFYMADEGRYAYWWLDEGWLESVPYVDSPAAIIVHEALSSLSVGELHLMMDKAIVSASSTGQR